MEYREYKNIDKKFLEVNGLDCPVLVTVTFDHPEYGSLVYTAVGSIDDEIDNLTVAKYFWEKYNCYGIMFSMKILYQLALNHNLHEWVIYEGGNPNNI